MVASIVLHIVILAFLLFAGEYESSTPPKTLKSTAISVVAAPLQRGDLERTAKGRNAKTTTRTSNTKEVSKTQKEKEEKYSEKTSKVPDPKKKRRKEEQKGSQKRT